MSSAYDDRDGVSTDAFQREAQTVPLTSPSQWADHDRHDEERFDEAQDWVEDDLDQPAWFVRAFQFLTRNEIGQAVSAVALVAILGAGPLIAMWTRGATESKAPPQAPPPAPISSAATPELSVLHIAAHLSLAPAVSAPIGRPIRLQAQLTNFHIGDTLLVTGLPPGFALSTGERGEAGWRVAASDLAALEVIPPPDFVGSVEVALDYVDADSGHGEHATGRLDWRDVAASTQSEEATPMQMPPARLRKAGGENRETAPAVTGAPRPSETQAVAEPPPRRGNDSATPAAASPAPARAEHQPRPVAKAAASSAGVVMNGCVAKLDGKLLLMGRCRVIGKGSHRVTLEAGDKRFTLSFERDRTWRLDYGGQSIGKVFKTDGCWGGDRAYVCESRGAAKPEKRGRPRPAAAFTDATPRTDPDVPSPGRVRLPFEELFEPPAAR